MRLKNRFHGCLLGITAGDAVGANVEFQPRGSFTPLTDMRLAPIPMFFFPDLDAAERFAAQSSRTTHGAAECIDACRLLARIICRALAGNPKDEVALGDSATFTGRDHSACRPAERHEQAARLRGIIAPG